MNALTTVTRSAAPAARQKVRVRDLVSVLDEHPTIKVLTLDCFDTILWRNTGAPEDVFYDLASTLPFARLGLNAKVRMTGEAKARDRKVAQAGFPEVTLSDIYRASFPALADAEVAELADAEVTAEIAACFPHPDSIALIRAAHQRGLRIAIVSDTYLTEPELRRLLGATLPADAYAAITNVYCSSHFGHAKAGGMFTPVLAALGVASRDVLHIGDNRRADYVAPKALGMNAVHLEHHGAEIDEILRMQTTAACLLQPAIRETVSFSNPYRGMLSANVGDDASAVRTLGYASLGPIMVAFARWLSADLAQLRAEGKNPKPVFLLRDGYLPARIAKALAGADVGPLVSVSRFASFAASFRTAEDVEQYVAGWAGGGRFLDVGRQLGFVEEETRAIIAKTRKSTRQAEAFLREVMKPKNVATVLARSATYRERMFKHLVHAAGLEKGDTLVMVDLGYEGTAQRQLEPALRAELGVEVQGRYLIAARVPGWESSRKGLLDPSWCDDRLIGTLVTSIALLENFCAQDEGSTIGYEPDGTPIRSKSLVSPEQTARVKPIQDACEQFARDTESFFADSGKAPSIEDLRRHAVGALARMLLLPTRTELDYLAGFCIDLNLGVDDNIALFDAERGLEGLRRQGLFFLGSEPGKQSRIAAPVELRAASLELSLTMIAQQRFGLAMTPNDMTHRREKLGILVLRRGAPVMAQVEARATHDGWFSAILPCGPDDAGIGFRFGERNAWVQVESVMRIEGGALYTSDEGEKSEDLSGSLQAEGMVHRGSGLFECTSPEGFLLLPTPAPKRDGGEGTRYVCRIVFRPIAARTAAS